MPVFRVTPAAARVNYNILGNWGTISLILAVIQYLRSFTHHSIHLLNICLNLGGNCYALVQLPTPSKCNPHYPILPGRLVNTGCWLQKRVSSLFQKSKSGCLTYGLPLKLLNRHTIPKQYYTILQYYYYIGYTMLQNTRLNLYAIRK